MNSVASDGKEAAHAGAEMRGKRTNSEVPA